MPRRGSTRRRGSVPGRRSTGAGCRAWFGAALALATVALGCSEGLGPETRTLEAFRERWASRGPEHYRFEYREHCFCGPPVVTPVRIEVRAGEVVSVEPLDPEGGPLRAEDEYRTIDGLFDRLADALDRKPERVVRFAFDETLGYPTDVFFDFLERAADDEWGFTVSALETLSASRGRREATGPALGE